MEEGSIGARMGRELVPLRKLFLKLHGLLSAFAATGCLGLGAAAFLLLSPNIWLPGTLNSVSVPWLWGEDKGVPLLPFS